MKTEYECWKCPEWHETEFHLSSASFCKQRVTIGKFRVVIPEMRWLSKYWWRTKIMKGNNGKTENDLSALGKLQD